MSATKELFSLDYKGFISRERFWKIIIVYDIIRILILTMAILLLEPTKGTSFFIFACTVGGLLFIISSIPSICLKIRRLHDANMSGALLLLTFIYLYIVVLVFLLFPSNHINNKYVEKYLDLEPGSTNPMNFMNNERIMKNMQNNMNYGHQNNAEQQ